MTYCVGLRLAEGLVLLSDTRTNAGVDNISTFSKMHVVEQPGERLACMMTAGNLSVSQMVVNMVQEGFHSETLDGSYSLATTPSMFATAQLVGEAIRKAFAAHGEAMRAQSIPFDVSILLAGQVKGRRMRLFQIYSAGNFIEATEDTPFFQNGESKYGKPIIDRVVKPRTSMAEAMKCALVSFDSTMRSNLSVGLPLDIALVRRDALRVTFRHRVDTDDAYFASIRQGWSQGLRKVFNELPGPDWLKLG